MGGKNSALNATIYTYTSMHARTGHKNVSNQNESILRSIRLDIRHASLVHVYTSNLTLWCVVLVLVRVRGGCITSDSDPER